MTDHGPEADARPGSRRVCDMSLGARRFAAALGRAPGAFFFVTRTPAELSVCVRRRGVFLRVVKSDGPWSALAVQGPLDLNITGVLAGLATPRQSPVSASSRSLIYDTDYVLVATHTTWIGAVRVRRAAE